MEKPKKKEFDEDLGYDAETNIKCIATHNQACDDWEKWLPNTKEIWDIIKKADTYHFLTLAKAISRRLGGEK